MWRPGLAVANCFANGRKCLTEQVFPSPLVWVIDSGVVHPETNTPHWVQGADLGQTFISSAQKVKFHGWILHKFGVGAR